MLLSANRSLQNVENVSNVFCGIRKYSQKVTMLYETDNHIRTTAINMATVCDVHCLPGSCLKANML